jgi:hypothetical protein
MLSKVDNFSCIATPFRALLLVGLLNDLGRQGLNSQKAKRVVKRRN